MKQKRLTQDQRNQIFECKSNGLNRYQTANQLNVGWKEVSYWWNKDARVSQLAEDRDLKSRRCEFESRLGYQYSYLLGTYLGDGYINKQGKWTYKIRITQDVKYPNIINEQLSVLRDIYGSGYVVSHNNENCVSIYAHSKHLLDDFPQHGSGRKHERLIELEPWQISIVQTYPWAFIRGLIQTDGARYVHTVKCKDKQRKYVKYNFSNKSKNIIDMLLWACALVNLHSTMYRNKKTAMFTLTFNKREDVALLDNYVGGKS